MNQSGKSLLGRIKTLILCWQSPLDLHQFCLTKDSKYGLVGIDRNAIWQYFASIRLSLVLLCQSKNITVAKFEMIFLNFTISFLLSGNAD